MYQIKVSAGMNVEHIAQDVRIFQNQYQLFIRGRWVDMSNPALFATDQMTTVPVYTTKKGKRSTYHGEMTIDR